MVHWATGQARFPRPCWPGLPPGPRTRPARYRCSARCTLARTGRLAFGLAPQTLLLPGNLGAPQAAPGL
jgi:hypothetical protein